MAAKRDRLGALKAIRACIASRNETLDLHGSGLTALPSEIIGVPWIRYLDLSHNEISELPEEFSSLQELEELDIGHNLLHDFPLQICNLSALRLLEINNNFIKSIPPEISGLIRLVSLSLASNQLIDLPEDVGKLPRLEELYLYTNKFEKFPLEITKLAKLKELTINYNRLRIIPPEICHLTNLRALYIDNNELKILPTELSRLRNIVEFNFEGNPLPTAYYDAFEQGIEGFFAFLRSLGEQTRRLFEAKLLVTGEGRVGKSWALAALRYTDPHQAVGVENTTWGIDRGELTLPHPEEGGEQILLNSWDFGGQEIYRVTHQFFFSQNAIYLLVWNPRAGAEQCRVREWLRTIALRTGSTPMQGDSPARPRARVIMVATHARDEGGVYSPDYGHDRLDPELREMIVDRIAIDSDSGHNIDELRAMIAHHAARLPEMGQPLNARWADARDAVLALRETARWIDFDQFSQACAAHGVTDPVELRSLAWTYLHSLGRAVWYGDNSGDDARSDEAVLADTIVLDAEWLSRAFVQVLEDAPTKAAGGMLDHGRFRQIWTDHDRDGWIRYKPQEYEILKQVMRRFDVALPTRESHGERSLVPQLVPVDAPELPWGEATAAPGHRTIRLSCQLDYEAVGLAPRLIAAAEPWHVYENDVGLYWEGGAFLREPSFRNEALVRIVGKERPRIDMTVSGAQPGFFMQELFKMLESESVLAFWKGMTRSYSIGCPGSSRDGTGFCPHFFPYDPVVRRIKEGKATLFNCPQCDNDWTAEALIAGFEALRSRSSGLDERYMLEDLYNREQMPAPRLFLLEDLETRLMQPTSWGGLIGKRFRLTLLSEFSGKPVVNKEFKLIKTWVKWLGPVTRLASLALTGAAVPLGGDLADQFGESAALLDKLAELPMADGVRVPADHSGIQRMGREQLASFARFLIAIDLDPREQGMEIGRGPDGKWYWMSAEEKATYTPQAAA